MVIKVAKYGGSSVADAIQINKIKNIGLIRQIGISARLQTYCTHA